MTAREGADEPSAPQPRPALPAFVPHVPEAAPPEVRQQVEQVVEDKVARLRLPSEVDGLLRDLEARARRNKGATAAEHFAGLAAIRRFADALGPEEVMRREMEFSNRLAQAYEGEIAR